MEAFRTRHKNHAVHTSLQGLWDKIADIDIPKSEDTPNLRDAYARFLRVCRYITYVIENSDPVLWNPTALNAAKTAVDTLLAQAIHFQTNKNVGHLRNQADAALDQFAGALPVFAGKTVKEAVNAIDCYFEDIKNSLGEIDAFRDAINEEKEIFVKARESFETKLASLQAELKAYQTQFEEQKGRVDQLISDKQAEFTTSQTTRAEQFAASQKEQQEAADTSNDTREKDYTDRVAVWEKNAAAKLQALDKKLERATEIVGIIASTGLSGNYQIEANKDHKAAGWLRIMALVCFGFMAYLVYSIVKQVSTDDFNWEVGLFRLGVSAVLLVPAFYCSKESNKHRTAARKNRRIQLELEALEPYLEKLTKVEDREEIIKSKVDGYFAAKHDEEDDDVPNKSTGQITLTGDQLLKTITSIIGKFK